MIRRLLAVTLGLVAMQVACAQSGLPFDVQPIAQFDEPWALDFLPDGRMLVTEKKGNMYVVSQDGTRSRAIGGMPDVAYGGQGGLGDVAVHPDFADNGVIYISYAESGAGDTRGAAVARAVLNNPDNRPSLSGFEVVWRQYPKLVGRGHYAHRILFDPGHGLEERLIQEQFT